MFTQFFCGLNLAGFDQSSPVADAAFAYLAMAISRPKS